MAENDDHRIVSRENPDGTRHIAALQRTPETDQLSDDQIITSLQEWKANRQPSSSTYERWPMPASFNDWLDTTKPAGPDPCPTCGCWSLRIGAAPGGPGDEKVVCTMLRCVASPFYGAS
ncbi:hypothetical protein SAMN04490357_1010 [Streptomyces misionensis]|uniref:Uncharacterized protein n=1 Tax=Streptomyces misionensis TaxID=67331 RepID=A0A1H4P7G4_9ACTN|nr:hypothetical protein [Streptomyces misionensis]SEC03265.1 hypothetical protein SAMN04490357_1010 [Streptomyces misionensis]